MTPRGYNRLLKNAPICHSGASIWPRNLDLANSGLLRPEDLSYALGMTLGTGIRGRRHRHVQSGMTLIELVVAIAILLVVAAGILALASVSMQTTENQGHLMARTAEYAQDKMEQLLALSYCDADTNTTTVPSTPATGTGLAGCPVSALLAQTTQTGTAGVGGSSNPSAPAAGYVDYLDASGKLVALDVNGGPSGPWEYIRVWQVALVPNTNSSMKQITVTVRTARDVGASSFLPRCTVTAVKSYPF
jgi:prepilin-type N-terminal cleavage/methylation domain-containing protein